MEHTAFISILMTQIASAIILLWVAKSRGLARVPWCIIGLLFGPFALLLIPIMDRDE